MFSTNKKLDPKETKALYTPINNLVFRMAAPAVNPIVEYAYLSIPGVSNLLTKCAKNFAKNFECAIIVQIFCDVLWGFRPGPSLFL